MWLLTPQKGDKMRKIKKKVKELFLITKEKEYDSLSLQEKSFLKELQYQACLMADLCRSLTESEIVSLINRCKTEIQLESALHDLKVA